MTRIHQSSPIQLLGRLFDEGTAGGQTDAQLAARFAQTRDPEAFAAIVARHGPMVLAICRGRLGAGGDVDDAFQATFLILLNRLGTFRVDGTLGGWLGGVARRVARQARLSAARRRRRELSSHAREDSAGDPDRAETFDLVRQEVDRLPERYRTAILLCDLQGMTRDEAAATLGCPPGTIAGRLDRARRRLRERLQRRGLAPALALPDLVSWRRSLDPAVRAASALASGTPATSGALDLATRSTRAVTALTTVAGIALAVAACLALALSPIGARRPPGRPEVKPVAFLAPPDPAPAAASVKPPENDDPKNPGHFVGRVVDVDGKPVAGAEVLLWATSAGFPVPGPVRALSGPDGRFVFDAPDMTAVWYDGSVVRRPGRMLARVGGYGPDTLDVWGRTTNTFVSHMDPIKGAELTLRLVRDDVPIRGRLLGPDNRPVVGARVRLISLEAPLPGDGGFEVYLNNFRQSEQMLFGCHMRSLYVEPEHARGVLTDREGRFQIAGLGRDRLASLLVTAPGLINTDVRVMTRDAPDIVLTRTALRGANFTVSLRAGRALTGIVRDRESHAPIAGMVVGDHGIDWSRSQTGAPPFVTGADGRFTIPDQDPDLTNYKLRAFPEPGVPYLMGETTVQKGGEIIIECSRGIPFRIRLVDEAGAAVDARVEAYPVAPNPHLEAMLRGAWNYEGRPPSLGARRAPGLYEGFVVPGPGAVLVKMTGPTRYRPAYVDPKGFFAPGKTDWSPQDRISAYGTHETLALCLNGGSYVDQDDFAAIVLVNPPVGSKPLELSATLYRDRPRDVKLVDPEGRPVDGLIATRGWSNYPVDGEPDRPGPTLRLPRLHPDRGRRMMFFHDGRKLIGVLQARGDGDAPYVVRMQPWATITGRIVEEDGKPFSAAGSPPATLSVTGPPLYEGDDDPDAVRVSEFNVEPDGRFTLGRLIPGRKHTARMYRQPGIGRFAGIAFEDLAVNSGEVRDLGDIRVRPQGSETPK